MDAKSGGGTSSLYGGGDHFAACVKRREQKKEKKRIGGAVCVSLCWKATANQETRSSAPAKDITSRIWPIVSCSFFVPQPAFVRAIPFQKVLPAC